MWRCRHAGDATATLAGDPNRATKRVRGVPKLGGAAMRTAPLGPWVKPPYRATKRVRGVPKCGGAATWTAPLGS
eukprot:3466804-Pyramimonas_sp.AAC.1